MEKQEELKTVGKAQILLKADSSDVEEAIAKVRELNSHLEKAKALIGALARKDFDIRLFAEFDGDSAERTDITG